MSALQELLDSLRSIFKREATEASDLLANVQADLEADLEARQARLDESPMDAIERLQDEIADDDGLDEVRQRIDALDPPDLEQ